MRHSAMPKRHLYLVPDWVDAPAARQFVPANVPCPAWCEDCWKGSNHGDDPDPGVSFHHSAPATIQVTDPDERPVAAIGVELERLDNVDAVGRTSVWLRIPDENAQTMSVDQAEALALAILDKVRAARMQKAVA